MRFTGFNKKLFALTLTLSFIGITQAEAPSELSEDQSKLLSLGKTLLAGDVDTLVDTSINSAVEEGIGISKSFLERYFPTVEISYAAAGGKKPTAGILVVAPLSDEKDIFNTFFAQASGFYQDNRTTLNLGLGYRFITDNKKFLYGINAFYDHEFPYDHGRTSVGLEAMSTMWEVRANQYWATTEWKTGRYGLQERALNGFDIEAGIPLPYMNWTTVFVKQFEWQAYGGNDNKEGQTLSLRAQFPDFLTGLEVEAGRFFYSGTSYTDENYISINYNVTELFKTDTSKRLPWITDTAYRLDSVEDKRYQKVRRENLIVKQINQNFTVQVKGS